MGMTIEYIISALCAGFVLGIFTDKLINTLTKVDGGKDGTEN